MEADAPTWQFNEESWDKDRAIREFHTFLQAGDDNGVEAARLAIKRHGCWHEALSPILQFPGPDESIGQRVFALWISYGFGIARSMNDNHLIIAEVLKHLLPPYKGPGLTLYRGQSKAHYDEHWYGFSWTPKLESARNYSAWHRKDGCHGVVLRIDATPEMIVAAPNEHSSGIGDYEYVLDPKLLKGISVVA